MAKLPRIKQEIFGSEAGPQDIGVVGSLHEGNPTYALTTEQIQSLDAFKRGLRSVVIGENSPILEEDNGMYKLITQQLAYLLQRGIPEWNEDTVYFRGSWVSDNSGNIYYCLLDDVSTPPSDPDDWIKFNISPNQWPINYVSPSKISDSRLGSIVAQDISGVVSHILTEVSSLAVTPERSGIEIILSLVKGSFDDVAQASFSSNQNPGIQNCLIVSISRSINGSPPVVLSKTSVSYQFAGSGTSVQPISLSEANYIDDSPDIVGESCEYIISIGLGFPEWPGQVASVGISGIKTDIRYR